MTTAAQRLAQYNVTMAEAQAFLVAYAESNPQFVFEVCLAAGLTNDMIGEIVGWPGAAIPGSYVEAYFSLFGIDSDVLNPATVVSVSSDSVIEGGDVIHNVQLSGASSVESELAFLASAGSVSLSDYSAISITNGVQFNGVAFVVPAGVSSFSLTLTTANDSHVEGNESMNFSIGGIEASGMIVDDDEEAAQTVSVVGVSAATATEGGNLVTTVTLSGTTTTTQAFSYAYLVGPMSTEDFGAVSVPAAQSVSASFITIGPGVSSFDVIIATVDDSLNEGTESTSFAVDAALNTITVLDNDAPASVTVQSVSSAQATEGSSLVNTVTLSSLTTSTVELGFGYSGVTASHDDWAGLTLSNGVTINTGTGMLVVPSGVSTFTMTLETVNDTVDENDETLTLTVGGVAATNTIVDNDGGDSGAIFEEGYMELAQLLKLNQFTGSISNASLRAEIVAQVGLTAYSTTFDPTGIDGWEDGTWTTQELGFSHLGNLPATEATLESIFFGTFLNLAKSIDSGEAQQLQAFLEANEAGIEAGVPSVVAQYVDLILDIASDLSAFSPPDFVLSSIIVNATVEVVAQGGSLFDALPI